MKTLADIGEDALVRLLTKDLPSRADVIAGPGDDCAIVRGPRAGRVLVLKTDTVVEQVHFLPETPPRLIGRKALARVLSDMAAAAGTPEHALVTLIAAPETPVRRVAGIYSGLRELAARHQVAIVGGETSRGPLLILSICLTGSVEDGGLIGRGGGRQGHLLWVTGRLGGSLRGRHLRFEPRLEEARWLARKFHLSAMMDISDGLARDLPRLAAASGLGYEVRLEDLPRTRGCTAEQAWTDGEDYELLFATPPDCARRLSRAWARTFPDLALTCIGKLTEKASGPDNANGGWDHFK